jgi:hypothetical protein
MRNRVVPEAHVNLARRWTVMELLSASGTSSPCNRYSSMPNSTEIDRARAQRIVRRREELKADAPKALHDYYAAQNAILERTRKLREERLAREAKAEATG